MKSIRLCKQCLYLEFFQSVFNHIQTENKYYENKFPNSVQAQANTNQQNSEYQHFSHTAKSSKQFMKLI